MDCVAAAVHCRLRGLCHRGVQRLTALQIVGTLTFMLMLVLMAVVLVAALVLRHWVRTIATVL